MRKTAAAGQGRKPHEYVDISRVIPHKDCASDAKSDFLSDCIKSSQAYWRMSRDFYVI